MRRAASWRPAPGAAARRYTMRKPRACGGCLLWAPIVLLSLAGFSAEPDRGPAPRAQGATKPAPAERRFTSHDIYRLRSVGDVQISPDGTRVAYTLQQNDRPGRPYAQVWVLEISSGKAVRIGSDAEPASGARWSRDGKRLAYVGYGPVGAELTVAGSDGANPIPIAPVSGTNHPLPGTGESIAWSPDGTRIAFVSSTPGPEMDTAGGDPMVITRYLYKPTATEGATRFNDNRRLHIFVAGVATRHVRQLTSGAWYEHSIDWSPDGGEILFVSNREADPDRVFNYDVFALSPDSGAVRRVASTKSAEYTPRWSPDGKLIAYLGTKRPLTSSETTMEDTHAWVMNADGTGRREVGAAIDNRQEDVGWAPDGRSVICTVQEGGNTRLYRLPISSGNAEAIAPPRESRGAVGSWSAATGDRMAYSMVTPSSPAELYFWTSASHQRALTSHNAALLADRDVAEVEAFTFPSFDGTPVEAFLTKPVDATAASRHPLIAAIHGGPHGQQGPAFNAKAQIYAAHGYATLMVNYRGSTGYGQKLADAIFKEQDAGEARDIVAGVDAALARYKWLDASRLGIEGGSYGGQLTNWLITQTTRFKAAIPLAGISNLVSFNYTAYYHDYLAVEFGAFPHEEGIADLLWARSPIRYAARVRTPTMFLHGENDNDVPIGEAEQFFIALKDVGVETVLVRYPREGHGLREPAHVVDSIDRSIAWYDRHFEQAER